VRFLRALDDAVYRVERGLVALFFGFMSLTVFVHTLHGGIDRYALASCGDPAMASCGAAWGVTLAAAAILFALGFAAVRARRRQRERPLAGTWKTALVISIVATGALQGLLWAFPRGWEWSAQLALALLLWVGLLGASLVTKERRHIHVEAVKKFLPPRLQRFAAFLANLLAAVLCAFVATIGALFTERLYIAWSDSGGRAAILEQVPWIPEWTVGLAIPMTFAVMALRFMGHAAGSFRGEGGPVEREILAAEKASERLETEAP
jgi:TRAP-type C4-dicarboxylate transport system permease small subunit